MKTIMLKIAGSEREPLDIILHQGVTAGDVLAATNLTGHVLCLVGSPVWLPLEEALYDLLTDYETLYACLPVCELY